MAVTAAPAARPVTERRDRVVRHAEVVGVWAVDCVCAHRVNTDWAAELLGDTEHRHEHAPHEEQRRHGAPQGQPDEQQPGDGERLDGAVSRGTGGPVAAGAHDRAHGCSSVRTEER